MNHLPGRSSSDVTDEEWRTIAPLLPPHKKRGRPRADDRTTLNAMFYVLHTGCQWQEIPRERYGAYSTAANRLRTWKHNGTWRRIQTALLEILDGKKKLNMTTGYIDGSIIASKRGDALQVVCTVTNDSWGLIELFCVMVMVYHLL